MALIQIETTDKADELLAALRDSTGATNGDLFRIAISALAVLLRAQSTKRQVIIHDASGKALDRFNIPLALKKPFVYEVPPKGKPQQPPKK